MTVTAYVYGPAMLSLANKEIDFVNDTVMVMLCTSTYVPNVDTQRYLDGVSNEIVGTGYTTGGLALTAKTSTYEPSTNTLTLDCADPSWLSATFTSRYAVFYVLTDLPSTSPLLCYWDFGIDAVASGANFTLNIDAAGLLTFTV